MEQDFYSRKTYKRTYKSTHGHRQIDGRTDGWAEERTNRHTHTHTHTHIQIRCQLPVLVNAEHNFITIMKYMLMTMHIISQPVCTFRPKEIRPFLSTFYDCRPSDNTEFHLRHHRLTVYLWYESQIRTGHKATTFARYYIYRFSSFSVHAQSWHQPAHSKPHKTQCHHKGYHKNRYVPLDICH